MERPYIICHMIASVDGRIDCAMVDKISGDEYYTALQRLDCPTNLTGRVTMEHYSAEKTPFAPIENRPIGHTTVHVARKADGYTVAVDTMGRLRWPAAEIDGHPLLCIVSEDASQEYLEALRQQGISYIATGKNSIDLPQAMHLLRRDFGVERLAVLGGGHINGGFLTAGLIDEISLMIAPGVDGRRGWTAVFDGIADQERQPVHLSLTDVERFDNGTVWLRYKTEH